MKKLIFLTIGLGIVLGIIIGANVVNRCASAQSNFPMCVTVYKYLVWPGTFPKTTQVIPVTGTGKEGELQSSGFEVYNKSALKFPAVSSSTVPACTQNVSGLMYYDKDDKNFKCCKWDQNLSKYVWSDCGGGGSPRTPTIPFRIYDKSGQKVILEINE